MFTITLPGSSLLQCSFRKTLVKNQHESSKAAGGKWRVDKQKPPGLLVARPIVEEQEKRHAVGVTIRRTTLLRAQAEDVGLEQKQGQVAGILDGLFFTLFRRAMSREVGWDSPKPGYEGLVEVANRLMAKHASRTETEEATVRILRSLFPPALLPLFRLLVAPVSGGRPAALLTARVTQATCQWLMGPCKVNDVELPDGSKLSSGVLVEKCKYLEESKCTGICIHTCKMPTQTFIKKDMGIPLVMEPNFEDYSCQFKFGVEAPPREEDEALRATCLAICPSAIMASSRPGASTSSTPGTPRICPQVVV